MNHQMKTNPVDLSGMKVLLVDDTPANLTILRKILEIEGYSLSVVTSGELALKVARKFQPDLVLLDIMMPDMDGFETCRRLKEMEEGRNLPIIFITAKDRIEDIVKGFSVGAVDFISKPVRQKEVCARVRTHLNIQALIKERDNLIEDLTEANKNLDQASRTDPLTELSNRRDLYQKLDEEVNRYKRSQKSFSVTICDIDHFKQFNDKHGHDAGDFVLKHVAELLRHNSRAVDIVGRWGGEEFLIVSPETDISGAKKLAEKLRKSIELEAFRWQNTELKVTMSFGISSFDRVNNTEACIKEADECLYKAKERGRNRVVSV